MIKQGSVLILGAGASKPYGFPLGTELRHNIIEMLKAPNTPGYRALDSCGFSSTDISTFREELHDSLHDTIDDFISDRPSRRAIGTHAIVIALMMCEEHDHVFPKKDWYPHLLPLLDFKTGAETISGIITLNYDRSLEHYISHSISVSYEGDNKKNALAHYASFPIVHIHGQLGHYPKHPYKKLGSIDAIKKAAEELRITSDPDLENSTVYAHARMFCQKAPSVICLGFGYHRRVMERLGLLSSTNIPELFGTAIKLPQPKRNDLKKHFGDKLHLDNHGYFTEQYFKSLLEE